jgi:predicted NBD/HSP70 family sugar kinase
LAKTPLGSRYLIRDLNRSIVLNVIKEQWPISRAEIARKSGLSPASITKICGELLEEGWILETEPGESSGGRRPILMEINPSGGYVIGLKVTETGVIGVLTDLTAGVLQKRSDPIEGTSPDQVAEALAKQVESLLAAERIPRDDLLGVGVGLAGVVDALQGLSRIHPFLGWKDVPVKDLLQTRLDVPVYIDNDVNTLSYAEQLFGRGQGVDHFIVVTIGRGVGLGLVLNGQVYKGAQGGAGEFGHTIIEADGLLCDCGKKGCLEAYVGEKGLIRAAGEAPDIGNISSIEELIDLGLEGHGSVRAIFERAGEMLGRGISNLITLFNPSMVLISGEGVRAGEMLFKPMRESVKKNTMPVLWSGTKIVIDPWGDDAWAIGAACLVLGEVFRPPVQQANQHTTPE